MHRPAAGRLGVALRVAGALGLSGLSAACGGAPAAPGAKPAAAPPARTMVVAPRPAPAADPLPSLDDLASHAGELAPGMREAARRESRADAAPAEAVRADAKDECVRVLFAADVPVRARLEDSAGGALASTDAPVTAAALAARGPVCVRRGDAVKVAFSGDGGTATGARVRWIAWASP